METFLRGAIDRCSNLTFIFEILILSIFLIRKKSINSFGDMVSCTPQCKHKIIKKFRLNVQKGAGCYMYTCDVISSVA